MVGPGAWELRAHGKMRSSKIKTTQTQKAIPTPTHMMFVKLMEEGLLKAVISQNCDGLHRRSGLPVKRKNTHSTYSINLFALFAELFELHGNSNVERCRKCKRKYLRDFRTSGQHGTHVTGMLFTLFDIIHHVILVSCFQGRKCDDPKCGGVLVNTIINFGENLPESKEGRKRAVSSY